MEEDYEMPIILGGAFFLISITLIDGQKGKLTIKVQDQEVGSWV